MKKKKVLFATLPLLAIILAVPLFRTPMLHWALAKTEHKLQDRTGIQISFYDPAWKSWNRVGFSRIEMEKPDGSLLFVAEFPEISLTTSSLLGGDPHLTSLSWEGASLALAISLDEGDSGSSAIEPMKILRKIEPAVTSFSSMIPENLALRRNQVTWPTGNGKAILLAQNVTLDNHQLETELLLDRNGEGDSLSLLKISGEWNGEEGSGRLVMATPNPEGFRLPLLREGAEIGLSTGRIDFEQIPNDNKTRHLSGNLALTDLWVKHPKISPRGWKFPAISADFQARAEAGALAVSVTTEVNGLVSTQSLSLLAEEGEARIDFEFPRQDANLYLAALPRGGFYALEGMELEGKWGEKFTLELNDQGKFALNATQLDSALTVKTWGPADPNLLKGNFTHLPWKEDRAVRIAADAPGFTPLNEIPQKFLAALILSEDANYFSHQGFDPQGFALAMQDNLKTGKFSRGASTLPMQLVRNVFLVKDKTLERKLEEIVLTGLIEKSDIPGKKRMLEIYINVIEWGSGVYGIRAASQTYFGKEPRQLNWNEMLFLTGIIPNPQMASSFFEESGELTDFADAYFAGMAFQMHQLDLISDSELENMAAPRPFFLLNSPTEGMGKEAMSGS
ncbi:MAG: transglycosylase domain-containing protein [Bacteroidia bacterium]|nr:transglycosylase domain-containing protein [Bacteroidia bacterium]